MKYLKSSLLLIVLTTVFCVSCEDDPCDAIVCLNDGICEEGICECPPGFEGELCGSFTREKIVGNFDLVSNCMGGAPVTNTWGVGASATALNEVVINNFHELALNVIATINDPTTIEIKEQFIGGSTSYTISGSGTINSDGQFTIQYTIFDDISTETTTCTVDAVRQE